MQSFYSIYDKAIKAAVDNRVDEEFKDRDGLDETESYHLDCLLNPDRHPLVYRLSDCDCSEEQKDECSKKCFFGAISKDGNGNMDISDKGCTGCSACIENCKSGNLADRKDILPVCQLINNSKEPVYAMIAPAFISQFSEEVTPGKLRAAFKKLGFAGMIEVALFADILTLKEALEFDQSIHTEEDFLLTSCCCPVWIAMIRKIYDQLVPHVPASVSPMVACGRSIKKLQPEAKTVFIGPCLAKKAEAREKDICDAVDHVLTFREVKDIFEIAGIDPALLEEDERDHSSAAGRIYARTGGVSEAVQNTLNRLKPYRTIPLKSEQANGVTECKALLNKILQGDIKANFLEGMGCTGGCVGGPRVLIDREKGAENVGRYGKEAAYETPVDNPYVIELLQRLGFDSIDRLLNRDHMFTRDFSTKTDK